jgi:hypothetical protein
MFPKLPQTRSFAMQTQEKEPPAVTGLRVGDDHVNEIGLENVLSVTLTVQ